MPHQQRHAGLAEQFFIMQILVHCLARGARDWISSTCLSDSTNNALRKRECQRDSTTGEKQHTARAASIRALTVMKRSASESLSSASDDAASRYRLTAGAGLSEEEPASDFGGLPRFLRSGSVGSPPRLFHFRFLVKLIMLALLCIHLHRLRALYSTREQRYYY